MIQNYLKIALRNLLRNKVYSFINIAGLAIAFSSTLLLFLTAHFELSYDDFHKNKDHIFKIYKHINEADKLSLQATVQTPLRPALMNDFPTAIKYSTRFMESNTQVFEGNNNFTYDLNYVDADFFKIFSFKILKGNPKTALNNLGSVVIKEDIAKAIFGKKDPIGRTLKLNFEGITQSFIVSAVVENSPENSSIENEISIRFENNPNYQQDKNSWNSNNNSVYIQLSDNTDYQAFEKRLQPFTKKYYDQTLQQLKQDGAKADNRGELMSLRLLPLKENHFDKKVGSNGIDPSYPYILLIISALILLIACINFINLTIARSLSRAKEVGMRKVLGAFQNQIVRQFWGEAFIICLVALFLGGLLAFAFIPEYNAMFRSKLSLQNLGNSTIIISLILGFLVVTLLAGGYPAWLVARVNTIEVLKGKMKKNSRSGGIRNTLIVVQFSISVLLITCTLIVWNQTNYLRNKPLGFNQSEVVSIPVGNEVGGNKMLDLMRSKLANQPRILSLSGSDNNLGRGKDGSGFKSVSSFEMKGKTYATNGLNVDFDYLKTIELKLIAGRDFSRSFASDSTTSCVINETMAKQLGLKNPIGINLPMGDSLGRTVIGVVKDYHFESLRNKIESMTLFFNRGYRGFGINYIFVKIASDSPVETMALLSKTYKEIAPSSEFKGSFLDENTNNLYKKEERISKIFVSAAGLAILLSCLGLFAIALITITQRTKEIGIRKVLGASVSQIVGLLSKDFLILVFISILIASPIAYYFMQKWLQDFAFRIEISWWIFALAGAVALLIALLTVSYQAIRAALANPVKSLRTE